MLPALINEIDSLGSAGFASRPLAEFAPVRSHPVNQGFFTPLNHPMDPETLSFMNLPVEDSDVPSLNIGGWYDIFLQQTIDDFSAAKARNVPASLLIGPWAHAATGNPVGDVNFGVMSSADVLDLNGGLFETQLSWFDQWLKGAATNEEAPVKVFIMGSNRWATMDSWPPPEAREVEWYLGRTAGCRPRRYRAPARTTTPTTRAIRFRPLAVRSWRTLVTAPARSTNARSKPALMS